MSTSSFVFTKMKICGVLFVEMVLIFLIVFFLFVLIYLMFLMLLSVLLMMLMLFEMWIILVSVYGEKTCVRRRIFLNGSK